MIWLKVESRKSRKSHARFFDRISQSREIEKVRDFPNPNWNSCMFFGLTFLIKKLEAQNFFCVSCPFPYVHMATRNKIEEIYDRKRVEISLVFQMAINLSELQQSFNSRNFNGTIFGSFVADKWVSKLRKKAAFNFKPVKQNEWLFQGG